MKEKTKAEQLVWLFLGFLFTAGMLFFVQDGSVMIPIAVTFTTIVGIFLGIDIALMIKKTTAMPPNEFKHMNKSRYITALVIFALLLIEAFVLSSAFGRNSDSLYASFGMGFLIVIGGLVAGVEGNKMATNTEQ